jgi:DNA-binding protein
MRLAEKQIAPTVLVGKKPAMSYVLAVLTGFQGGSKEVVVKARGRAISRAVDVVQMDIRLGTEQITDEQNRTLNVSTIEIVIGQS